MFSHLISAKISSGIVLSLLSIASLIMGFTTPESLSKFTDGSAVDQKVPSLVEKKSSIESTPSPEDSLADELGYKPFSNLRMAKDEINYSLVHVTRDDDDDDSNDSNHNDSKNNDGSQPTASVGSSTEDPDPSTPPPPAPPRRTTEVEKIVNSTKDTVEKTQKTVEKTTAQTTDTVKKTTDSVNNTVEETVDNTKKLTDSLLRK
jgi:hypothetical protein